jgi:hypothetical protein
VRVGAAAELAIEIDRLALCIHRPTGRRADLMAELTPLEMPRLSIVVVAARFLAAGRLTLADYASMSRYETEGDLRRILDSHVRRGLLIEDGDLFTPTSAFQSAGAFVLRLQAEEAANLWSTAPHLSRLADLARIHVQAALASDLPLDAFRRQTNVHGTVPATDAGQLLAYITELRYLRSDIHALCLADEGLSGPFARTLHRLWRGFQAAGDVDLRLVDAGLVHAEHRAEVTSQGRAKCERVETATNERFAAVFDAVADAQSTALLEGMRGLPGEDPRPLQDR